MNGQSPAGLQPAPGPTERLQQLLIRAGYAAMGAHVLFLVTFALLDVRLLALFNAGSVACYAVVVACAMRGRLETAIALTVLEVITHAAFAVAWLGWESGFHYYIFALMQLLFMGRPRTLRRNIWLGAALCGLYVALDMTFAYRAGLQALDAGTLDGLHKANLAATFLLIAYFAWFSARTTSDAEQRLRTLATTDVLTGLINRRCMLQLAEEGVRHAVSAGQPLAVLLIDIDHFKRINDAHGHEAGDTVLVDTTRRLGDALGPAGRIARWGGEEFIALLPGAPLAQARAVADRLRGVIADRPVTLADCLIDVTVTVGVAQMSVGETFAQCVARADAALYEGKRLGRNRVVGCEGMPVRSTAARRDGATCVPA